MSDGLFQLSANQQEEIDRLARETMPSRIKNLLDKADRFLDQIKYNRMTGAEKISMKRLQQKVRYSHSIKDDYQTYPDFELIDAAKAIIDAHPTKFPEKWNKESANKLCSKDLETRLAIAGALLAAQIDILNYTE